MKFGINILISYDPDTSAEAFAAGIQRRLEIVRAARDAGFGFVCIGQHFLTDPPMHNLPQSMILLARIAAESGDMELMTGVLLLPLYPPPLIAEEIATLDGICNGRFIFSPGLGYREDEFIAMGVPRKERVGRFEESIEIIKRLFTEDRVDFRGKYYTIPNLRLTARSVRRPRPPIWIGGGSDAATRRAARIGDGLYSGAHLTFSRLEQQRAVYLEALAEHGKSAKDAVFTFRREVFFEASRKKALEKALPGFLASVANYRKMGIEGSIMPESLDTASPEEVERELPFLLGTPEDCVQEIGRLKERLGLTYLNIGFTVSRAPHAQVLKSIETFGAKVIPHFKG